MFCNQPKEKCVLECYEKCELLRDLERAKSRMLKDLEDYKQYVIRNMDDKHETAIKAIECLAKKITEVVADGEALVQDFIFGAGETLEQFKYEIHLLNTINQEFIVLKRTVQNTIDDLDTKNKETNDKKFEELGNDIENLRSAVESIINTQIPVEYIYGVVNEYVNQHGAEIVTNPVIEEVRAEILKEIDTGCYDISSLVKLDETTKNLYALTPFEIKGGFSVRNTGEKDITINGVPCSVCYRVEIGTHTNGIFTTDTTLSAKYSITGGFTNRIFYVPFTDELKGKYARIQIAPLNNGSSAITSSNWTTYKNIVDGFKVYTGSVRNSVGVAPIGSTPATIRPTDGTFRFDWTFAGLAWKYTCLTSIIPLRNTRRVVVDPDMWIVAKQYEFDPVTRTTNEIYSYNFYGQTPCFGADCVIEFKDVTENSYAIIGVGKVPIYSQYDKATRDGKSYWVDDVGLYGLNRNDALSKVRIESADTFKNVLSGASQCVSKNLELLKNVSHQTVTAMFGNDNSETWKYLYGKSRFAGIFYGGGYIAGTFFYNVSPVTYFTSLLNPNSNAYGENEEQAGVRYGIMCSAFTSLLHGHTIPRTTFDYRYNDLEEYEQKPFNFTKELPTLKRYDVVCQGVGQTGHCIMVEDVADYNNTLQVLKLYEATTPATGENMFVLSNAVPYVRADGEKWYHEAYDYVAHYKPEFDNLLVEMAEWEMPYVTPQKVMVSRGYNAIYIDGKNPVHASIAKDVTTITVYKNLTPIGTYTVTNMSKVEKNEYYVVEIPVMGEGEYLIHNSSDAGVEKFNVINADAYSVTAEHNGTDNTVKIVATNVDEIKYVNLIYKCTGGTYEGQTVSMCYYPKFVNGVMSVPDSIDTGNIGIWTMLYDGNLGDHINVVYKTKYDTNTFFVDAENDKGV